MRGSLRTLALRLAVVVLLLFAGEKIAFSQSPSERREAAVLKARAGQMAAAQADLRALLTAGIDDGLVAMDLATLLQQDGKSAEAVDVFTKAARPDPPDYALLAVTRANRDLRRYDDAARLAREGMRLFPDQSVWPLLLSLVLSDAGNTAEALAVLKKPEAMRAPPVERLLAQAYAYRRAGDPFMAMKTYGEAVRLAPANAGVRAEAASVLRDLGAPFGAAIVAGATTPPIAAEQAGAMVRWGEEVKPADPARRFEGTDAALARLDGLLVSLPPDQTALRRRVRLDRVVALRDRVRMQEAAEEAEALRAEGPLTNANALPLVDDPNNPGGDPIPSDQPAGFTEGSDLVGWTYSVYLQDAWKVIPSVTVNFGARFDAINGSTQESQLSPRINVVWEPDPHATLRAGYARYFTPPPLAQVNANALAVRTGTTAQPEITQNSPVKAERADYFDVGVTLKPIEGLTYGFSAYYKFAQNLLDEGQFGAPISLTSFNYANAQVKGFELFTTYDQGPWSVFANLAWSRTSASNINSAQFNFSPDELNYIANHSIYTDHDQGWTGSAGAAYVFNQGTDWATRVSADLLFGSGLRTSVITPNDTSLPAYATLNLALVQKVPISVSKGTQVRLDVMNVTDASYQLRTGDGVGVGAPQYGMRRTFLVTLAQKF